MSLSTLLLALALHAGPPPTLTPLSVSVAGDAFHVVLAVPADLRWPRRPDELPRWVAVARLVMEQGGRPTLTDLDGDAQIDWIERTEGRTPTLDFIGKGTVPTRFRLRYQADGPIGGTPRTVEVRRTGARPDKSSPVALKRLGDAAELQALAVKEALSGGFSYFTFARKARARQLKRPDPGALIELDTGSASGLFEMTTGAMALEESLALGRSPRVNHRSSDRTIDIERVRGITIADHPWKLLIGDRKARPEPLAECIPHDNWYFTAERLETVRDAAKAVGAWGGAFLRAAQVQDRDHDLLRRYQLQLCLPLDDLTRTIPAKLVRGVAITGSDFFWAEGTDVTVIFDTPYPKKLLENLRTFSTPRRRATGAGTIRSGRYNGVEVEAFGTFDGSVSCYQAVLWQRVIVSNSFAALKRVLDTIDGERPSLAKSLDFQYMRTAFERDPKQEDGFVFLSDPFLRTLLGPATRIKAMRRLDTRSRLMAINHAALLRASDGYFFPPPQEDLEKAGTLAESDWKDCEDEQLSWSESRREAFSGTFGSVRHGTPLIEVPIRRITGDERAAYEKFRREYEQQWRQYFDPVGVRFRTTKEQVRVEAYILPLVRSSAYRNLLWLTDRKETTHDPGLLVPNLAGQARWHFHTLGMALQLDDFDRLPSWLRHQWALAMYPDEKLPSAGIPPLCLVWGGGKRGQNVAMAMAAIIELGVGATEGGSDIFVREPEKSRMYRGVKIIQVPMRPAGYRAFLQVLAKQREVAEPSPLALIPRLFPRDEVPTFYTALIGDGWHTGFNEKALERRIDAWKNGAKDKAPSPAALSVLLSRKPPGMAAALDWPVETQVRQKALSANVLWQALYDARVILPWMTEDERRGVAMRLWGFVPAAPDGSRVVYDPATREVRNLRHGTWGRPIVHDAADPASPLGKLLRSIQSIQADLRFREDGVHTTVTISRK